MSSCEKCWGDAFRRYVAHPMRSQAEHYRYLLEERNDNPCAPKEQAGQFWNEKNQCDSRLLPEPAE